MEVCETCWAKFGGRLCAGSSKICVCDTSSLGLAFVPSFLRYMYIYIFTTQSYMSIYVV